MAKPNNGGLDAKPRTVLSDAPAREPPNDGHSIATYNATLTKGLKPRARKALQPLIRELVIKL